jgi:hypothetical protein
LAENRSGYAIIPDKVRLDQTLTNTAIRVYLVLSAEARDKKSPRIGKLGLRLISRLACCSVPATAAALKDLVEKKYVNRIGAVRTRYEYELVSKWHTPKDQRGGWKGDAEETLWQGDGIKVVRKTQKAKYVPQRYRLKEESA